MAAILNSKIALKQVEFWVTLYHKNFVLLLIYSCAKVGAFVGLG